jgi:rod shape-determining protein MreB
MSMVPSRPVKNGVIADYRVTEAMIRYFVEKVSGKFRFSKPDIINYFQPFYKIEWGVSSL